MRLSQYFLPLLKQAPSDAQIVSHQLMLRAGLVRQASAGIYSWLPIGLRVLRRIEQIVREEQERAGAIELLMPTIQSADLWRESGRYEEYGKEMLRITDRHGRAMLYGPTNEEQLTEIFRAHARSWRDVPRILYHIQWKFRDEIRPRFGVMRGREFLMKDSYSLDLSAEDALHSYRKMFASYLQIFARMGLTAIPMKADTGPIGGDLSHEFVILADTGESAVYFDHEYLASLDWKAVEIDYQDRTKLAALIHAYTTHYAASDEKHDPGEFAKLPAARQICGRGIEVGHIFLFGVKYSQPMKCTVQDQQGRHVPLHMGSYGVGISRLVGAIIEACHDEKGICWPETVAPFHLGLLNLRPGDAKVNGFCDDMYQQLQNAGVDTLYDDSAEGAGAKFAIMDLLGLPWQMIIGPKGVRAGQVELKSRRDGQVWEMTPQAAIAKLTERSVV